MREALTILGFGPCRHMFEVHENPEQTRLWRARAASAPPDWEALFAGYASCVDWPSAFCWRALVDICPEARVILTTRPAESWWRSFSSTIPPVIQQSPDRERLGVTLVAAQQLQGRPDDQDHLIALCEAHVAEVKASVPPERLPVCNLGNGRAPLCAHLGAPIPDLPYPSRDTRGERPAESDRGRARGRASGRRGLNRPALRRNLSRVRHPRPGRPANRAMTLLSRPGLG